MPAPIQLITRKSSMSDLHDLCRFLERPIGKTYVDRLKSFLEAGIPATYTIEEAYNYMNGLEEADQTTTTTPLHLIFTHFPLDYTEAELLILRGMAATLLEYGAGWSLIDINNDTPGCILLRRGLGSTALYGQIVDAGVRAELLLRKVNELDVEIIKEPDGLNNRALGVATSDSLSVDLPTNDAHLNGCIKSTETHEDPHNDPSHNQAAYLKSELLYQDGALVTKDQNDAVMMEWERDLMWLGCESLFKGACVENGETYSEVNILNIGFGMGIIDEMISAKRPAKHYICEAHPDVLRKLKADGWYQKQNVVILEGRWQEQLDKLLSSGGVYFNGIYYDTFSENYQDMLEFFDYVVGLLKPHGVFSFFNGLGADRQVVYDVYRKLVEIDLANYGLACRFREIEVPQETMVTGDKSVWDGIRKTYWACSTFYHPEVRFVDV